MYEIVVVGAGQLGSRHLQGLASLHKTARLHMVDPSHPAIEKAKARVREIAGERIAADIKEHSGAATLPRQIDLAIIATTADCRLSAMTDLLGHARVKYLVLEKVLFQKFAQYEQASDLIGQHNSVAWVNCPRRVYPVYQTIKGWFALETLVHVEIFGGGWGLGCNGIHFVDLFSFLTDRQPTCFDISGLKPGFVPARRLGYVEYSGTLRAHAGDQLLVLTANQDSSLRHLVTLRSEQQNVVIDEIGGTAWRWQGQDKFESLNFRLPYQSEITASLVTGILEHGRCHLPSYEESAALHLAFLEALATHGVEGRAEACLVT